MKGRDDSESSLIPQVQVSRVKTLMLYTCLRRLWLHPSQDVQHMLILLLPFSYVILLKAGWPRNGQRMSPDVRSSTLWAKMNFHHFLIKISDFDTTDDMHSQNI